MISREMFSALALAAIVALPAVAQELPGDARAPSPRAEVLVLGTYHMNNPGRDVFNTQADDVLSPERQAEIARVVAVLEKFRPTKIAVEADPMSNATAASFAEYLDGKHELTRNEKEQLGFRLAAKLRHAAVYPVDADGEFPFPRLVKFAQATGRDAELDAVLAELEASTKSFSAYLASHTILEALVVMNSEERVAQDVGTYFRMAQLGEPWDWAGADLVSDWFRRNMRIYSNIVQLIDSPNERVLVLYGAGHLGWLRFAIGSNPELRLRTLAELQE